MRRWPLKPSFGLSGAVPRLDKAFPPLGRVFVLSTAEKGFSAGGERGMLEGMLAVQKKLYGQHAISPTDLAKTYSLLGNKNEALRYLKVAYEQRDGALLFVETTTGFERRGDDPGLPRPAR